MLGVVFRSEKDVIIEVNNTPHASQRSAPRGVTLFKRVKYNKPHQNLQEQLTLLIQRGLIVTNRQMAEHYLGHLNYYRLSAYWIPLLKDRKTNRFTDGTTFEEILNFYIFDRELRILVLDAIERIEISVRSQWAYSLTMHYGSHAHLNSALFTDTSRWQHSKAVAKLRNTVSQSKEEFIAHFRSNYDDPLPPLWALVEIMTFGELSYWYAQLKRRKDRNAVARIYDMDETNFVSFLHHLSFVRNLCAHHSRLWNREFTITLKLPKQRPSTVAASLNPATKRKIYNTFVTVVYLLDQISPSHHWKNRLFSLMEVHRINISLMGFPPNFRSLPIWII